MKWSVTQIESNPTASAARAIASKSGQRAVAPSICPSVSGSNSPTFSGRVRETAIACSFTIWRYVQSLELSVGCSSSYHEATGPSTTPAFPDHLVTRIGFCRHHLEWLGSRPRLLRFATLNARWLL